MNRFNIHYFSWVLTRLIKKSGLLGLLGIALLLASEIFYVAKLMPLNKQVEQLNYELAQNRNAQLIKPNAETSQSRIAGANALNTQQLQATQALQVTAQDIQQFYALFPAGATLPQWLNTIAQTAVQQGLKLNRGDYKLTAQQLSKPRTIQTKQGQFSRYEIVLPVTGQYTQIRLFINEALQKIPALALADLQIKRANSTSPVVEARLVFVLMLQGDSW